MGYPLEGYPIDIVLGLDQTYTTYNVKIDLWLKIYLDSTPRTTPKESPVGNIVLFNKMCHKEWNLFFVAYFIE